MVPSVIVISTNGFLVIQHMDEDIVLFWSSSHFWKTFNMMITMVETWSNDKCFVSVFLSISEDDLVLLWNIRGNSNSIINFRPFLNLTTNVGRFSLIRRKTVVSARNILSWNDEFTLFRDDSHLVMVSLRLNLNLLGNGGSICSSNKDNIEISFFIAHRWFLWTSTHASCLCVDKSSANLSLS